METYVKTEFDGWTAITAGRLYHYSDGFIYDDIGHSFIMGLQGGDGMSTFNWQSINVGTLKEIGADVGAWVAYIDGGAPFQVEAWHMDEMSGDSFYLTDEPCEDPSKPVIWRDMTEAEKGALLLANHEGKAIECLSVTNWYKCKHVVWDVDCAYRIKPEPTRETVTLVGDSDIFTWLPAPEDTHRITFDKIDGVIDCASVKMEALE